jgi:hypothetical protein
LPPLRRGNAVLVVAHGYEAMDADGVGVVIVGRGSRGMVMEWNHHGGNGLVIYLLQCSTADLI